MAERCYGEGFDPRKFDGAPFMDPVEGVSIPIAEHLSGLPGPETKFARNALANLRDGEPVEHSLILAKRIQMICDNEQLSGSARGQAIAGMQMLAEMEADVRDGNHVVSLHNQRILAALGGYSLMDRGYGLVVALRLYSPARASKDPELKRVLPLPDCAYAPVLEVDAVVPYAS